MPHKSPEQDEQAERGRAAIAAAVSATHAPLGLRERITADHTLSRGRRRRRRRFERIAIAGLATGAIVAGVLVGVDGGPLDGSGSKGPTVLALAALAARPIVEPAPAADPARPSLLDASVAGLSFPDYSRRLRWRASGARADRVAGRAARTVHYHGPRGAMAAYTIVDGTDLAVPPNSRTVPFEGTDYRVSENGDRTVVTWERAGHTCVLSGASSVGRQKLLRLAWWRA